MAHVYFNCRSGPRVLLDQRGTDVDDMIEARDYAVQAVQSLIGTTSTEDWRNWVLHVSDDLGEEVFEMPFSFLLGKPH